MTSEEDEEALEPDTANDSVSRTRVSRWPEVSLRLGFQSGKQRALPYHMLQDLHFDPDSGVVLEFVHCRVEIRGRNLAPLFDGLADHKIRHIREIEALAAERFPEGDTVVTKIAVIDP
jgi:hypothetical protein